MQKIQQKKDPRESARESALELMQEAEVILEQGAGTLSPAHVQKVASFYPFWLREKYLSAGYRQILRTAVCLTGLYLFSHFLPNTPQSVTENGYIVSAVIVALAVIFIFYKLEFTKTRYIAELLGSVATKQNRDVVIKGLCIEVFGKGKEYTCKRNYNFALFTIIFFAISIYLYTKAEFAANANVTMLSIAVLSVAAFIACAALAPHKMVDEPVTNYD